MVEELGRGEDFHLDLASGSGSRTAPAAVFHHASHAVHVAQHPQERGITVDIMMHALTFRGQRFTTGRQDVYPGGATSDLLCQRGCRLN